MATLAPMSSPEPFCLGGPIRWRPDRSSLPGLTAVVTVLAAIALPLRGLYRATGASMEEGFMLVFPTLVQRGKIANVDFLHLYGPASLDALALWYRLFGDTLESERTFGLLQHLGIVFAVYALARVAGHMAAVMAALVAVVLILTPIGLSALAWHGALALGLWSVVFMARARATGAQRDWWTAGGLAGLALGFRPDLVLALGLAAGWALLARRASGEDGAGRGRDVVPFTVGAAVGLLPMWVHLVRAGPVAAVEGMVIDPVFRLRPGRELPRPPSWSKIDGALQAVAESAPPWWRIPALAAEQQLFVWFFAVIALAVAVPAVVFALRRREPSGTGHPLDALAVAGLFGLGILPQALQRPDSTHLAWVAVVSWPLAVAVAAMLLQRRSPLAFAGWRAGLAAGVLSAVVVLVVCPFFTFRTYLLHSRVSVGDLPVPYEIARDDHRFWVGDPAVASAMAQMIPELEARTEPGDRLFVGPGDLRRTVYADTYVYWLFDELEPATYYIEMDPGLADREGSGMADDIRSADFVVLTNTWSGWQEPNASSELGSPEHNQAIADHFCLVASYETNLVLLFERCEGGGGFDPAIVAGRAAGIGQGGVERAQP